MIFIKISFRIYEIVDYKYGYNIAMVEFKSYILLLLLKKLIIVKLTNFYCQDMSNNSWKFLRNRWPIKNTYTIISFYSLV